MFHSKATVRPHQSPQNEINLNEILGSEISVVEEWAIEAMQEATTLRSKSEGEVQNMLLATDNDCSSTVEACKKAKELAQPGVFLSC